MFKILKFRFNVMAIVGLAAMVLYPSGLLATSEPVAHAATNSASVTVNASSQLGTLGSVPFGLNTAVWDGNLLDSSVPGLLKQADVNILRFPGGSTADVYHWQTNSITPGQSGYANSNDTFDNFMNVVQQTGAQAMVTVNYGSNSAGTGGGDPTEAANWVKYANVTKGYGVKYWEIGNEVYGNGEYGSAWETDLHQDHSPTAYANNALTYISDMKAVDPSIKIGVVLTAPGNWPDGQSPNWNSTVLSILGSKIDFVDVHWYAQSPGSESDSGLLSSTSNISSMMSTLKSLINQYCGSNAPNVQVFLTESNSVSYNPGKQTVSLVNGLFLADDYMTWLENGAANVDWWDLHNGIAVGNNNSSSLYGQYNYGDYGILSDASSANGVSEPAAETPFPPYYGLQMLSYLAHPGDTMVSSSSNQSLVGVHAVKQANGNLAVLLENKDPNNSYNVNLSLSGYTPASSATQYFFGEGSTSITSSQISGAGSNTSVTIPPYSLTTVVFTPGSGSGSGSSGGNPTFSDSTSVSPNPVSTGMNTTVTTTVKDTSGSLSNGIVDIEIYDASGNRVAQQYFNGQNFSNGQSQTYSYNWTAPSTTGNYTVKIGVFGPNWSPTEYWDNGAATVNVTGAPTFSDSTSASPNPVAPGANTTITTTVKDSSGSLTNGIVDIEVYDASGNRVAQQYFSGQNFASGQSQTYSYNWTASSTAGTYTVKIGVFGPNWSPTEYWDNGAASISVN